MNMLTADTGATTTPITYDTTRTITLTLGQALALHSALFDAIEWNREKYPITSKDIRELKNALIGQVEQDLAAAAAWCQKQIGDRETARQDRMLASERTGHDPEVL